MSKNQFFLFPFLLIISFLISFGFVYQQKSLAVKVSGVRKNSGKVILEIYNKKSDWLETPFQRLVLPSDDEVTTFSFSVPFGKYAITVYQDINENGETDMNILGIPKEPVGFGNNYKPFGEPKFESSLIEFSPESQVASITLYKVF